MDENLKALMVFNKIKGFGIRTLQAFLSVVDSPAEILKKGLQGRWPVLAEETGFPANGRPALENWTHKAEQILEEREAEKEVEQCSQMGIQITGFGQPDYPKAFNSLYDPPVILYAAGNLLPEDWTCFAIVGTREPSPYGVETTRRFSAALAQAGLTIVSGFARGIDAEAHKGALSVKGRTVAVLGCGIDQIYPANHRELYQKIRSTGALISEHPSGTPPLAGHFPRRNRLISGLSLGVLVVEAHEKSGSLITAACALEQGKEVFAIPGRLDSLRSRGTNRLIKNGALLAETPEDILCELEPLLRGYLKETPLTVSQEGALDGEEESILSALREKPLHLDELVAKTAYRPEDVCSRLTRLEIHRKIRRLADGKFAPAAS